MIHFAEVGEFVGDQIITHEDRGLNQAPVERDGPASGTGAPARSLAPDLDARDGELPCGRGLHDEPGKLKGGKAAQMQFNLGTPIRAGLGRGKCLIRKAGAAIHKAENVAFAAEPDLGSRAPRAGRKGAFGEALKLLFDPPGFFEDEFPGELLGSAARDGDADRSTALDTKDIAARAGMADEDQFPGGEAGSDATFPRFELQPRAEHARGCGGLHEFSSLWVAGV